MYQRAADYLSQHQSICIASHMSPDGDAIGSMLALGLGLHAKGKKVTLFSRDPVPGNLRFLPHADLVASSVGSIEAVDALVLVDCAQPERAGKPIEDVAKRHPPFLIDHHILPGVNHDAHCIDPKAAATGEVVYKILQLMRCAITDEIATCVYCTLVSDTGNFRYSNTSPAVLRLAADLVDLGVAPWHVASNLTEQNHPATFALLRRSLQTLHQAEQGKYAFMVLSQEMLRESEAIAEYAENFVGYPRSIAGVEVAALYRELPDGRWKVSLRSKRYVDVAAIAALFQGGGHEHAAGCTLDCDLPTAQAKIGEAIGAALKRRPLRG